MQSTNNTWHHISLEVEREFKFQGKIHVTWQEAASLQVLFNVALYSVNGIHSSWQKGQKCDQKEDGWDQE